MWAYCSLLSNFFPFHLTSIVPSSQFHFHKFMTSFIPCRTFFKNLTDPLGTEVYAGELTIPDLHVKYHGEASVSEIELVLPFPAVPPYDALA